MGAPERSLVRGTPWEPGASDGETPRRKGAVEKEGVFWRGPWWKEDPARGLP